VKAVAVLHDVDRRVPFLSWNAAIKEIEMALSFVVPDMSCGHCVAAITKAVKTVDPEASVEIDLATHHVTVNSTDEHAKIDAAIRDAGYTPSAPALK